MGLIITFLALAIAMDPGTLKIGIQGSPSIYYNIDTEEVTVPVYNNLKHGIICLERNDITCLRGRK